MEAIYKNATNTSVYRLLFPKKKVFKPSFSLQKYFIYFCKDYKIKIIIDIIYAIYIFI